MNDELAHEVMDEQLLQVHEVMDELQEHGQEQCCWVVEEDDQV